METSMKLLLLQRPAEMIFERAKETSKKQRGWFFLRHCAATNGLLNVRGFWSIKRKGGGWQGEGVLWPPEVDVRTVAAN